MQDVEQLRQLRGRPYFADWPEHREEAQALMRATIDKLVSLGPTAGRDAVMRELRAAVERFNELDDGFIGTIEREDLCDALYKIGEAAGVPSDEEWVDEYRDW
jgi:hypothetical protein